MHHTLTQGFNDVCLDLSNPGRNRVSGEISIAPAAPKNHCQSRTKGPLSFRAALRAVDRKIVGHYKYFGPAALCFIATLLIANLSILSITARAQRKSAAPATAQVPSPRSVFGFNPGDDRTIADWKQITDYFARLDQASDRVQVQTIGTSTLGVPLIAAFISAPENIRNLAKYKEIQRRLADPRLNPNDGDVNWSAQLVKDGKTVVVISCSIHSTEIVASQMSTQLAYNLASAKDADTLSILHNTILILIPSPNPDGVDIVGKNYRETLGTALEGREPP